MEVAFRDGRKVLDSANANYSYGTADDLWKKVLKKIPMHEVQSTLLFGLGGGTILEILAKDLGYEKKITAVEIDPVIIRIAREEFSVKETKRMEIVCMDAYNYVKTTRKKFDLLIVDISIDFEIPEQILSLEFWSRLAARVRASGMIVFNALDNKSALKPILELLSSEGFDQKLYTRINGTNNILIAKLRDS